MDNNIKTPTIQKGRWKEALLYGMLFLCPDYRKGKRLVWLPEYDKIVDWLESLRMPYVYNVTKEKHFCYRLFDEHYNIISNSEKDMAVTYESIVKQYSGKGLLLLGTCGLGKSYITCTILPKLMQHLFGKVPLKELCEGCRDEYRMTENGNPIFKINSKNIAPHFQIHHGRSLNEIEDDYNPILESNGDFKIIDDLGEEGERVYYGSKSMVMCDVMDAWSESAAQFGDFDHQHNFPQGYGIPILSTNLNVDELEQKYGSRFISRIKRCFSHVVVLQGDDLGGHDDEPLDISTLPFYDDWLKFSAEYPKQADYCGFIGYLFIRYHVPVNSEDMNKDVATEADKFIKHKVRKQSQKND